jgi:hypothetical protein
MPTNPEKTPPKGSAPYTFDQAAKFPIPLTTVQRSAMVAYILDHKGPPNTSKLSDADLVWAYVKVYEVLHPVTGKIDNSLLNQVMTQIANVSTVAGKAIQPITSVLDFLNKLLDPHLWLRILEAVAGLVLIGVGVAKLSSGGGAALRKIPVYGKAIPA